MVRSFGLLDRPRVAQHDEIAMLASELAETSQALVSLVERERNWFSGGVNYPDTQACRWTSFCTHAITQPGESLWVEDAAQDFRFADNPYVVGEPFLKFYAGVPIVVNGHAVGTLCVFDGKARPHDPRLIAQLSRLAKVVAEDLASRHRTQTLQSSLLASADALIDSDDYGVITNWSEGAERLFGFTVAEAVGKKVNIIVPPESKAAHDRGFEHWRRSGSARLERRIELSALCKDGSQIDVELWMSVIHERGVPHIHANIRDISERKKQAALLMVAKSEAEAANIAKSTFLTNMSHELRTPLNGVIGVCELLAKTSPSDHQKELISIIQSSSGQLSHLIGDILDLARIESGKFVPAEAPMSLGEIVEGVRSVSALSAHKKGLSLISDLAADTHMPVLGDALCLKQVLTNLVSNAVKFTQTGSVKIGVTRSEAGYRFAVNDTGIGFDEDARAVLFQRFQQADGSITRRFGGTGLGLAISLELVAAMGGELDCEGQPGAGSTFWFTLPLRQAREVQEDRDIPQNGELTLGRVLVVDDNPTNRRVAELILNTIGTEVVCVEDGQQAVDAFLRDRYDAILMDMMMPVMDGVSATRAIRHLESTRHLARTPIVMLTANNLPEHIDASLNAGADVHLAKPVNAAALFGALDQLAAVFADTQPNDETARLAS